MFVVGTISLSRFKGKANGLYGGVICGFHLPCKQPKGRVGMEMSVLGMKIPKVAIYNLAQFVKDLSKALGIMQETHFILLLADRFIPNKLRKHSDSLQLLQKSAKFPHTFVEKNHNKYSEILLMGNSTMRGTKLK